MNTYNPFTLSGKTILITGASSGIGRCTAIEASKMGASLIITGRNEARLNQTLQALEGDSHTAIVAELDTEEGLSTLAGQLPKLDGVFFCAGIGDTTLVKFMSREKIMKVMDIDLISPMLLTKVLLSKKKVNDYGSLVYMSSVGAEWVTPGLGVYSVAKNGLNAFVKAVAIESSKRHIRANSIMAGTVKTEMIENQTLITKEQFIEDEKRYPLGYGKPEDVAYAAIYLLSDASRWITGSHLKMDGGGTL